ncbi:hypothetical protein A5743_14150 [Mycolicibacterium conceptionense]|nr:hypothetical protein A5743_14150 [Mycolicibacterium conceptionense]
MAAEYGIHENGDRGYLVPRGSEAHYRYGYEVAGAQPRYLGINAEYKKAVEKAKTAAAEVREELAKLGAPTDVSWWAQKVTCTTIVDGDEPKLEAI